tara:strand:- start:1844 stop:3223 length:1380 start_codon:yes stop_codon:yes gene_type:complete
MFKKIEIWILYLVILLGFLLAIVFGVLVRQELVGSTKLGWVSRSALFFAEIPMNTKRIIQTGMGQEKVEDRFPYLKGFNGEGIDEETYLLLSRYDGDQKESVIELIDLSNFNVLHTWNPDIDKFNKSIDKVNEFKNIERNTNKLSMLYHPKLTQNGNLLFGTAGYSWWESMIRKIDACSNLVFQNTSELVHHSIELDADASIWAPALLYPQSIDPIKVGRNLPENNGYLDDSIVKLSPEGEILFEKSISELFIENDMEYLLFSVGDRLFDVDPIHLNDIQPVNYDGEFWKKGDVFISLRHQSMVILYRPSSNEIIWKGVGKSFHQHDVDILDDHRIAIFNNNSKHFFSGDTVDGNNEVLIYDFETKEYSSYLSESLISYDVRTITEGRSEILPNGDLMIEESNFGRTLYFNADGSLAWSFVNRASDGNVYTLGWSRILYTSDDLQTVNNFLTNKGPCNE